MRAFEASSGSLMALDDDGDWVRVHPPIKPGWIIRAKRHPEFLRGMEAALAIAVDHTPEKHSAALASHVTGATICNAIRAAMKEQE